LEQPLHMPLDDWKAKMKLSVAASQERQVETDNFTPLDEVKWTLPSLIPPVEIRKARERGVVVDLEWARQWHEERRVSGTDGGGASSVSGAQHDRRSESLGVSNLLPFAFSRSYSYVTTKPEDVRFVDLGPLLKEYQTLVQSTEALLAERAHIQEQHRRAEAFAARKEFYQRVCQVDPSLLEDSSADNVMGKAKAVV
jgi:hypothetical protein